MKLRDKFMEVNNRYDAAYKLIATKENMQPIELWILMTIAEEDRLMSQKELSEALYESKQTVNSAVKRLQNNGLIELVTNPDDRRYKTLAVTQTGYKFVIEHQNNINHVTNQVFDRYTPEQVQQLVHMLDDYVTTLEEFINKNL